MCLKIGFFKLLAIVTIHYYFEDVADGQLAIYKHYTFMTFGSCVSLTGNRTNDILDNFK